MQRLQTELGYRAKNYHQKRYRVNEDIEFIDREGPICLLLKINSFNKNTLDNILEPHIL